MKPFLIAVCFLNIIIISSPVCAMDFADDDNAISLKTISQKPISLKQQFIAFERKLSAELNQNNWLLKKEILPIEYIARLNKELPQILISGRTIEKFSRMQSSYFAKMVHQLINNEGYKHYRNVTGDTLATIHQSQVLQPCRILNQLPLPLKQYVMEEAYYNMKQNLVSIAFDEDSTIHDIHAGIGMATVVNSKSKTFQLWNLRTGELIHRIPHACKNSLIRFSQDGSVIITTSLLLKDPTKVHITLWNRETKKSLMDFSYKNLIQNIFLKNNILYIFDTTEKLYITKIDMMHRKKDVGSEITTGIKKMNPPFTFQGKYHVENNTILQKSFLYFLCTQAIKNTPNAISLRKIYDAQAYTSSLLTDTQKKILEKKIEDKLKILEVPSKQPQSTMRWL